MVVLGGTWISTFSEGACLDVSWGYAGFDRLGKCGCWQLPTFVDVFFFHSGFLRYSETC